ncbi:MAG: hypothetical protein ACFFCS_18505 [Candidatus Hodarchaeota archaeon]
MELFNKLIDNINEYWIIYEKLDNEEKKRDEGQRALYRLVSYLYNEPTLRKIIDDLLKREKKIEDEIKQLKSLFNILLAGPTLSYFLGEGIVKALKKDQENYILDYYQDIPEKIMNTLDNKSKDAKIWQNHLKSDKYKEIAEKIIKDIHNKEERNRALCFLVCKESMENSHELFALYKKFTSKGFIGQIKANDLLNAWSEVQIWIEPWKKEKFERKRVLRLANSLKLIILEVKKALRNLISFNYWIDKYIERTAWFNKELANKLKIREKGIDENSITQDLLIYLHDNGIPFSYNQIKQGFRPDVETLHCAIEIKIIYPDFTKSQIIESLKTAQAEIEKQKAAHAAHFGIILIYNCSSKFNLKTDDCDEIKIIDLQIALGGSSPSKDSKREIFKLSL